MKQVTRTRGISHEALGEEKVISSIEIAALLGKPHNDVLKAIRKMEPAWQEVHQGKFSQMQIQEKLPNGGYRMRPCFVLTKTESLFVATKFNDVARAKLVLRWEELELSVRKRTVNIAHRALLETEAEVIMRSDEIMKRELSQLNIDARNLRAAAALYIHGLRILSAPRALQSDGRPSPAALHGVDRGRSQFRDRPGEKNQEE